MNTHFLKSECSENAKASNEAFFFFFFSLIKYLVNSSWIAVGEGITLDMREKSDREREREK